MNSVISKSLKDNIGLIRDASIVKKLVGSSTQKDTNKYISNIISYDSSYWWCSEPMTNSYFDMEFKFPIYIFNYSFEVYSSWGNPGSYPQSWIGIGTYKEVTTEIDEVTSSGLNNVNTLKVYKTKNSGPFTALRYTMTGTNQEGGKHFCLGKLDIFGYYKIPNLFCRTIQRKMHVYEHILSYVFLIYS